MKHNWIKGEARSRCTNCGIEAPNYLIKKGGLPPCAHTYTRTHTHTIAPCLQTTDFKPVMACFKCPARIRDTDCERLRTGSVTLAVTVD